MKARDLLLATGLLLASFNPPADASNKAPKGKPAERKKGPGKPEVVRHASTPRVEGELVSKPGALRPAKPPKPMTKKEAGIRLGVLMRTAKRLDGPFEPLGTDDSYRGGEGSITVMRTRPAIAMRRTPGAGKPLRYFWFHGAGQATHNEMVTRLANAFDAAGVAVEIYSMPYQGDDFAAALRMIDDSPGKVLVGGHSAGGGPVDAVVRFLPHKLAGIVTVNTVNRPTTEGVPTLHFVGENDGGRRELDGLLAEKPRPPEPAVKPAPKKKEAKKGGKKGSLFGSIKDLENGGRWSFLDLDFGGSFEPPPPPKEYEWGDKLVVARKQGNRTTAILREGDHSARFRLMSDRDKGKAQVSADTREMNLALAKTLGGFLAEIEK